MRWTVFFCTCGKKMTRAFFLSDVIVNRWLEKSAFERTKGGRKDKLLLCMLCAGRGKGGSFYVAFLSYWIAICKKAVHFEFGKPFSKAISVNLAPSSSIRKSALNVFCLQRRLRFPTKKWTNYVTTSDHRLASKLLCTHSFLPRTHIHC